MRGLRVAVVAETFPKLSETFVVNHVKGLMDAGVEVDIYAFHGQGEERVNGFVPAYGMQGRTRYKPFEPIAKLPRAQGALRILARHPAYLGPLLRSLDPISQGLEAFRLHRLYEAATFFTARRYDLVHCHFGITAEKMARFQGWGLMQAPLVTSFHGYELDDLSVVLPGMYRHLQTRGRLHIANSGYTRQRLAEHGFDLRRVVVEPVSLDTDFFSRRKERAVKPFRILSVGRLVAFKGVEFALRALARARDDMGMDFEYTVVGTGPLDAHLRSIIHQLGLQQQVRMVGDRTPEEVREHLEASHVLLHTGIHAEDGRVENQGLVLQEAQCMEVPVVASDIGGMPEGLRDGETGFLVPQRDVEAIVDRIRILYADPERVGRMGRAGRRFVEGRYDIAGATTRLLHHYASILSR
jgi:colanic acid/amylovoran biosynthesis glycosyltransferase